MDPSRRDRARCLHITIVSSNPETVDGLEAYLRRAGVRTRGTRQIEKATEITPTTASVVVLFPDDFGSDLVTSALGTLRSHRPKTLTVLVTKEPKRFESLPVTEGIAPLVVPKPVWGWTILDAIRSRLDSEAPASQPR